MSSTTALTAAQRDSLQTFMELIGSTNESAAIATLSSSNWNLDEAQLNHVLQISGGSESNYHYESGYDSPSRASSSSPSSPPPYDALLLNFSSKFNKKYGSSLTFFSESLQKALKESKKDCKPVLFFITHFKSVASNNFIREVLLNENVSQILENNFIVFPWDITRKEHLEKFATELRDSGLHTLAELLQNYALTQVDSFPILLPAPALMDNGFDIPPFIDSSDSVDSALAKLYTVSEEFEILNHHLVEEKREREEREQIRRIQEEEYEASLKADLTRIEKMKEEEEKKRVEEEKKQKQIKEEERLKAEEAVRQEVVAKALPSEPAATEQGVMMVKFRLPGGKQLTRRFRQAEPIQNLVHFLDSQGYSSQKFKFFNSDFPKKNVMENFDQEQSFIEAKWPAREQIFVEEI